MRGIMLRLGLGLSMVASTVAAVGVIGATNAAPAAAATTATPACTFNGSTLPIVTGVTDGSTVNIDCTGLPALHPFLFLETSLLIAIDPKAAALLSGGATPSAATLEAALAALPEINPGSFTTAIADTNGDLNEAYTVPSTQPTDPNAGCPPNVEEFNSGLIGCAVAMIDLTTQAPVGAGSGVLEWQGYPFFPPEPTVAFNTSIARPGDTITVTDQPGTTTYWWLATLAALEALLGGGSSPPLATEVNFGAKHHQFVAAPSDITVTGASYDGTTFTPPSISGSFTVPSGLYGKHKVYVAATFPVDGLGLQLTAEQPLTIAARKK